MEKKSSSLSLYNDNFDHNNPPQSQERDDHHQDHHQDKQPEEAGDGEGMERMPERQSPSNSAGHLIRMMIIKIIIIKEFKFISLKRPSDSPGHLIRSWSGHCHYHDKGVQVYFIKKTGKYVDTKAHFLETMKKISFF